MRRELVVAVMNGASASLRRKVSRADALVHAALEKHGFQYVMASTRVGLLSAKRKKRDMRRFVLEFNAPSYDILFFGKSYGAKTMVEFVNELPVLRYNTVGMFTIDPNWPKPWNWTPNLNNETLVINRRVLDFGINVYCLSDNKREQSGCMVSTADQGPIMKNYGVRNSNHKDIVTHGFTRREVYNLLEQYA